jgi:hypothetical protein
MFPRLRTHIAPALLGRVDQLVELSTLGGYGLDDTGRLMPLEPENRSAPAGRSRDDCPYRGRVSARRCDGPARP